MKLKIIFFIYLLILGQAWATYFPNPCEEIQFISELKKDSISVNCHVDYQEFKNRNPIRYAKDLSINKQNIHLASFNILHPGMSKTRYKDFKIMAQIINQWDLIGTQELIPITGLDLDNNKEVLKNINIKPEFAQYYRYPGYINLLLELQKLDPTWTLIMSNKAEGSIDSDVKEYTGYFYRQNIIKPIVTKYCRNNSKAIQAYGCLPTLNDLNDPNKLVFSRRPFITSFKYGNKKLTLLNSHVVYTAPTNAAQVTYIEGKLPSDLPGVNRENFARLAEVKLTLDFMSSLEEKSLAFSQIYMGDLNLEKKINAWDILLLSLTNYQIFVEELTSLTASKISNNAETMGLSQNYDHFIFNPEKVKCENPKAFNFIKETELFYDSLSPFLMFGLSNNEIELKKAELLKKYVEPLINGSKKIMRIKRGKIVEDTITREKYIQEFERRMIQTQFKDETYYSIYRELISDHLPIYMNCPTK
jgi:endonuclease/exonuclease/phosphatase family metal-dependent hydrolase